MLGCVLSLLLRLLCLPAKLIVAMRVEDAPWAEEVTQLAEAEEAEAEEEEAPAPSRRRLHKGPCSWAEILEEAEKPERKYDLQPEGNHDLEPEDSHD